MAEYQPKIGLMLQTDVPEHWIEEFSAATELPASDLEVRLIYSAPMAGLYLYLPQAVMIFIATAFFGPVLAEAGKDSYGALKSACKGFWKRLSDVEVTTVTSSSSPKKAEGVERFNLAFSINGQTADGLSWKLVMKAETDPRTADKGIDQFIDLITRLNSGQLSPSDQSLIEQCREIGGTSVVTIGDKGELVPADPRSETN